MHLLSPVDEYFRQSELLVVRFPAHPSSGLFGKAAPPPVSFT